MAAPRIVGLGGTGRPGSTTDLALAAALRAAEIEGAVVSSFGGEFLAGLPLFSHDPHRTAAQTQLVEAVRHADGLIVATPGYHGGISGTIKNALDLFEDLNHDDRPYLDGRAVGCIVCAYGWQACGTTLVSLRSTVHSLRGWPTPLGVTLNSSEPLFDDAGDCLPAVGRQLRIVAEQVVGFARDFAPASTECGVIGAIDDIAAGRMVVVVGDDHEPEGYLVMAAERVTPRAINFMTRQASGWICLTLTAERCDELGLELMSATASIRLTVTIEAREGVTTGISVRDQAHTMRVAIDPAAGADDIVIGGHVRPLMAAPGGVLDRPGHAEASVDLARLAGLAPAGVVCPVHNLDGSVARGDDVATYGREYGLRVLHIAELIDHCRTQSQAPSTTRLPCVPG